MSREEFLETLTRFVYEVQECIGFDTDASKVVLIKLQSALEPLRMQCQLSHNALEEFERQVARQMNRFKDHREHFLRFDRQASGYMSYRDFETALHKMNLIPSTQVLTLLLRKYDPNGECCIDYTNFLRLIQAIEDKIPRSEMHDSQQINALHSTDPTENPDFQKQNHLKRLVVRIRAKLYQRGMTIREMFLKLDQGRYSFVTLHELHKGLQEFGIHVHPKELAQLVSHYIGKEDYLSLADFAKLLEGVSDTFQSSRSNDEFIPVNEPTQYCPSASTDAPCSQMSTSSTTFETQLSNLFMTQGKSTLEMYERMAPLATLSPEAFNRQINRWGFDADDKDILRLFGLFDVTGRGSLKYHEFVKMIQHIYQST